VAVVAAIFLTTSLQFDAAEHRAGLAPVLERADEIEFDFDRILKPK
jgi:hypothetical protein